MTERKNSRRSTGILWQERVPGECLNQEDARKTAKVNPDHRPDRLLPLLGEFCICAPQRRENACTDCCKSNQPSQLLGS